MYSKVFSVFDVETTGLIAEGNDRIVEVAIVSMNREGEVLNEWSTLIDAQRDVGRTDFHGISARDLVGAPTMAEAAEEIAWRISGTVPVAHNASFDMRFLTAELGRYGFAVPEGVRQNAMCTMQMSKRWLRGAEDFKLATCSNYIGHSLENAHCALDDALAAAALLRRFMSSGTSGEWDALLKLHYRMSWNIWQPAALISPWLRSKGARPAWQPPASLKAASVSALTHVDTAPYLDALATFLCDSYLAEYEIQHLHRMAEEMGLTLEIALGCHQTAFTAHAERVLNHMESCDADRKTLISLGGELGLKPAVIAAILEQAAKPSTQQALDSPAGRSEQSTSDADILNGPSRPARKPKPSSVVRDLSKPVELHEGDQIVLTGHMKTARSQLEENLRLAGFTVGPGVSKKTSLLVAADPDSLSGKAKKARDLNIPIVTEDYLLRFVL